MSGELFRRNSEEFCRENFRRISQEILETESQNCDSTKISHLWDQFWGITREFPRIESVTGNDSREIPWKFLKQIWRIWWNSSLLLLGLIYWQISFEKYVPNHLIRLLYFYFIFRCNYLIIKKTNPENVSLTLKKLIPPFFTKKKLIYRIFGKSKVTIILHGSWNWCT